MLEDTPIELPAAAGSEPVWVIDDDRAIRWVLNRALSREGIGWPPL